MRVNLSDKEREALRLKHRREHDRRIADRIKAVFLKDKGWTYRQISEALMIDEETASGYVEGYVEQNKLKHASGGSKSKLTVEQTQELISHLKAHTYVKVAEVCEYVFKVYGISYSRQGMTDWLHAHGFSYKKPKSTPAKADPLKQEAFIKRYEELMTLTPEDEPILFVDCVHPTMATKVSYGWIHQQEDKLIACTASRTRLNLAGAINLEAMEVITQDYETINGPTIQDFFQKLKGKYPNSPQLHLILDQAGYNKTQEVQECAKKLNIKLHYLPPYSPNLNPQERVWKVMNEQTRNNRVFCSVKEFKEAILGFFQNTWPKISTSLTDRINDNFNILKSPIPI
jgi:transposase